MDLSNNELQTVPTTFFSHSPRLAFVDLSMNHLKTMSPEIFLPCPKLTQIILRDNELSHAHSSWFRAFYYKSRYRFDLFPMQNNSTFRPYIDLSGNPWRCECSMISFRAWTNRNMWFLNIDGFQDVTCYTPSEVRGTSLLHLNGTQTQDRRGNKCSFPAVLDVLLFNRMQRLVVQTSAVGFPLPSIKWFGQLVELETDSATKADNQTKVDLSEDQKVPAPSTIAKLIFSAKRSWVGRH